jgi:hypothetical protein
MDWTRISGLWRQFQETAKGNGNESAAALDKPAPALRQFWSATRPPGGIQDPLDRQMDDRQRLALMKREIEEVERELIRFRAMVSDPDGVSAIAPDRREGEQTKRSSSAQLRPVMAAGLVRCQRIAARQQKNGHRLPTRRPSNSHFLRR